MNAPLIQSRPAHSPEDASDGRPPAPSQRLRFLEVSEDSDCNGTRRPQTDLDKRRVVTDGSIRDQTNPDTLAFDEGPLSAG